MSSKASRVPFAWFQREAISLKARSPVAASAAVLAFSLQKGGRVEEVEEDGAERAAQDEKEEEANERRRRPMMLLLDHKCSRRPPRTTGRHCSSSSSRLKLSNKARKAAASAARLAQPAFLVLQFVCLKCEVQDDGKGLLAS